MEGIHGYFDGTVCVPISKNNLYPNQKVLIIPIDEKKDATLLEKKIFGSGNPKVCDEMLEALKECRRVIPVGG